jgi:hypothetical protein
MIIKTTNRRRILGRRALLRGGVSGIAASLALPPLEAMFDTHGAVYAADGMPPPKRFGIFYWANGIRPDKWVPSSQDANWTSDSLEPLAPVKRYVNVLTNLECKIPGVGHHVGRSAALSGSYNPSQGPFGQATLPSVDRLVTDAWRGTTPFDALHVGISMRRKGGINAAPAQTSVSWDAAFNLRPGDYSPSALYQRLFQNVSSGGAQDPEKAKQLLARKSIIDLVSADARALGAKLGQRDRKRIDEHLEGLRGLERGLNISTGGACTHKSPGADPKVDLSHEDLDGRNRLMSELVAMAWACQLTRVAVVTHTVMQADTIFWQVGATDGAHVVTHDDRPVPADQKKPAQKELHGKIVRYTMGHFSQLLARLMAMPEGAGNLLDSAAIVGTSECGDGTGHKLQEYPWLIAGRAGGALKTGLHYRSSSKESISMGMLTALRAIEPTKFPSFGKDAGQATQPISALMA